VYVDDIFVTGNDKDEIQTLKLYLNTTFKIKNLGEANYFPSMKILLIADGLVLTQ